MLRTTLIALSLASCQPPESQPGPAGPPGPMGTPGRGAIERSGSRLRVLPQVYVSADGAVIERAPSRLFDAQLGVPCAIALPELRCLPAEASLMDAGFLDDRCSRPIWGFAGPPPKYHTSERQDGHVVRRLGPSLGTPQRIYQRVGDACAQRAEPGRLGLTYYELGDEVLGAEFVAVEARTLSELAQHLTTP